MAKSKLKSNGGMKTVDCRTGCGEKMEISSESVSGTCWKCVNKMMTGPVSRLDYVPEDVFVKPEPAVA